MGSCHTHNNLPNQWVTTGYFKSQRLESGGHRFTATFMISDTTLCKQRHTPLLYTHLVTTVFFLHFFVSLPPCPSHTHTLTCSHTLPLTLITTPAQWAVALSVSYTFWGIIQPTASKALKHRQDYSELEPLCTDGGSLGQLGKTSDRSIIPNHRPNFTQSLFRYRFYVQVSNKRAAPRHKSWSALWLLWMVLLEIGYVTESLISKFERGT